MLAEPTPAARVDGASAPSPPSSGSGWRTAVTSFPRSLVVQRVAIARALLASPSLLLCDEPTGNLDSANTAALLFFDALARQGLTLVVVTHDDEVAATARRVVRLTDGRIVDGDIEELDE